MRSDGFAQGLGAALGTAITVLVNGRPVVQSVLNPPKEGEGEGKDKTQYTLDIRTDGGRETLLVGGMDVLWIYGRVTCNKPSVDTGSLTRALEFAPEGPNQQWLVVGPFEMRDGCKAVPVRARAPSEDAQLAEGSDAVHVATTVEGKRIGAPVPLTLVPEEMMLFV
jgi:hypothetical protein